MNGRAIAAVAVIVASLSAPAQAARLKCDISGMGELHADTLLIDLDKGGALVASRAPTAFAGTVTARSVIPVRAQRLNVLIETTEADRTMREFAGALPAAVEFVLTRAQDGSFTVFAGLYGRNDKGKLYLNGLNAIRPTSCTQEAA